MATEPVLAFEVAEMSESELIIRVEHVSKAFGRRYQRALEMRRSGTTKAEVERSTGATLGVFDASFEVYPQEIFVLIGLSGSGKSTLLRLINRLIDPTEGEIYLHGERISGMPAKRLRDVRRKRIGMVFQHFGLLPNRTVLDNVTFGLEVQGTSRAERSRRGMETLELVGLQGQGDKRITELSGGMRQRVGLARALATGQEILLMDEPFSALDPLIRRDMQNLFLDIQGEVHRTVVFVTHDLDEALRLGHRVAILKDGEIVQLGAPEDILTNPADEYVERFVEDVDYAKVRRVESVMVPPGEVAYMSEGPRVALRRMQRAGLSTIFVVDEDRRLVGLADAEAMAQLIERNESEVSKAVDRKVARVREGTPLRETLPLFIDRNSPVAVTNEDNHLVGVLVRGALIAGLSAERRLKREDGTPLSLQATEAEQEEVTT